jgi:hypothetical protein
MVVALCADRLGGVWILSGAVGLPLPRAIAGSIPN